MNRPLLVGLGAGALAGAPLLYLALRRRYPWSSWVEPIPGAIATSGWGDDRSYRDGVHEGLDFRAEVGTPVRAVAGGEVIFAGEGTNAGNMMVVDHGNGFLTRYLHLDEFIAPEGGRVGRGEVIAYSGRSGISSSTPAHLHFDVRADQSALGKYVGAFGTPAGGFPEHDGWWAVPAEPLGPWRKLLSDHVLASAAENGVSVA